MNKLIFISPSEQYPNGFLVKPTMEKPDKPNYKPDALRGKDYHYVIEKELNRLAVYNAHLLTLPVYASCVPNKWKHGQELVEGVDYRTVRFIGCVRGLSPLKLEWIKAQPEDEWEKLLPEYKRIAAVPLTPPAEGEDGLTTSIKNLVNEIVYNMHRQDKEEDFLEKVRIVKEWLEKYYSHWMGKSSSNALLKTEGLSEKPIINEKFTDNGEHSHWELIDPTNGAILWTEEES